MGKIYASVDCLIGNTPMVRLVGLEAHIGSYAMIYAKLEGFNPAGSVKDRVARSIIDDAEKSGRLTRGSVIIEPTSGNTGIGLAAIAAARGYRAIIVMPDSMSIERQRIIKSYGAEVVLTDGRLGMSGAIEHAEQLKNSTPGAIPQIHRLILILPVLKSLRIWMQILMLLSAAWVQAAL